MNAERFIARTIIKMSEDSEDGLKIGFIKDISKRIYEYKSQGLNTAGIILQRTPLGFHSQEVAAFVGRLFAARLATQVNPVILTQEGIEWLKKIK